MRPFLCGNVFFIVQNTYFVETSIFDRIYLITLGFSVISLQKITIGECEAENVSIFVQIRKI
jgi:hypothetical protein